MAVKIYKKLVVNSSPRGGTQTNSYIVIHNTAGGTAKSCWNTFDANLHGRGRDGIACQYTVDDKEGYQMLEDNWGAGHCGSGNAHYAPWGDGVKNVNNSNTLGIEVADGSSVDAAKAIENCIELTRYLMQAYNIPISNVIRHGDVQNKPCPATIMKLGKWDYMIQEIDSRNKAKKPINLDISELSKADMVASTGGSDTNPTTGNGGNGGSYIQLTFHDTTTVQESLPNANTSDNWVDMHEIKGITLHFYPPYHNCVADSMASYFKSLGWNRNFHYKVDKDTKIDFDKEPQSGQTRGGNVVGSSKSDFEVKPKDPLYSGLSGGGGGNDGNTGGTEPGTGTPGTPIEGNDIATKIYNYCVQQGCSCAAACGIVGNCQQESSLSPTATNKSSGAYGLFQWLGGRYKALQKKASAAGVQISNVDVQIKHMWAELTGEDSTTLKILNRDYGGIEGFKKMTDPKKAALAFCESFERPGPNGGQAKKKQYAQEWYDKFSKSQTTSASANIMVVDELSEPFGWPVPYEEGVQSYYGYRTDLFGYNNHTGIDIVNVAGSGVYCYAAGKVEKVITDTKLEGYVRINHGNGLQTIYGSLLNDSIFVEEGDEVSSGQCIGLSGTTLANGLMHVHFEMMIDGSSVDPMIYVKPGGGNREIPEAFSGVAPADITDTNDNVVWDNIDKGKICFASADNNTHTYIDTNLFNNQHPKYTLSVGAFFYDEFDLVEKTGKVNWPKTEKKLIEQCAKALYDEGFTSTQLWREFDLNRAPSPFLYLDKDKWRAFCAEVDKQVEWLNAKYGKVTSTYVPNELLQDSNDNKFVETAPDGGTLNNGNGDNGNSGGGGNLNLNGALFIGDSWGVGIKDLAKKDGVTVEAVSGKSFRYFYYKSKNTDRLKDMKKDPTFIYVFLGINDLQTNSSTDDASNFFNRIKELWPSTPVYVGKVIHSGKAWDGAKYNSYGSATAWNEAADKFNIKLEQICNNCGFRAVSIDDGLIDSKGFLDSTKASSDGIHLKDWSLYYENIKRAVGASVGSGNTGTPGEGTPDSPGVSDSGEDRKADPSNAHKYGYVRIKSGCKFYKSGNTASEVLDTFSFGQEVYIISGPASSIFYHCRVAGKTGFIRAKNLTIVASTGQSNLYGQISENNVNKECILFPGTRLYSAPSVSSSTIKTYQNTSYGTVLQTSSGVKDPSTSKPYTIGGFYRVKVKNLIGSSTGWAKAYRVQFGSGLVIANEDGTTEKIVPDVEYTENGTVITYPDFDPITGELIKPQEDYAIMPIAEDEGLLANVGKFCYIPGSSSEIKLFKNAKDDADAVEAGLVIGDELEITGVKNSFYSVKFNGKTGYVKPSEVKVLEKGHGEANPGYIKSNCWILYDCTDLYEASDLKKALCDVNEQDQCVILDANRDKGVYKVKTAFGDGWVKAYAITFDQSEFRTAIDTTTNKLNDGSGLSVDDGTSDQLIENVTLENGDFEKDNEGWELQGKPEFEVIANAPWGNSKHFPYRKEKYARIRNTNDTLAGIKHDFEIPASGESDSTTSETYLRILFYVKQVTQDDFANGPTDPDAIKSNGIFVKLLDNNNKVKFERKISLSGISNTMWTRVGCVATNLTLNKYKLLIGNNKKYDLLIDDIVVESVHKNSIGDVIGDSDSTSGLTTPGAGATSIDNGGVMVYEVGTPTNKSAVQPSIKTIITQKEYEEIMFYSSSATIDNYTNSFEPDDKDLEEAKIVGVKDDSRLEVLTEELKTFTDNMIRYKVIETGPGSIDHCVKPVDELNVLYKNVECKVDPIYPDLVVPPKYVTSTNDMMSKNSIPMATVENASASLEDQMDKTFSYDYDLLAEMNKRSSGKPINYKDPYPYDDKITDLENHSPKVLIDEIESRLYSCNHPGCPIAHPMAKNFAMLNDMAINQSRMTEQRLVRLENTLATMTRYLGRMASRVNINCVYYGGQTTLGKYKCIRCLRDDRLHDGATVTMDQCLTCTRYEPIIGQVYDILDETGFNGSAILDDMQMSYMNLDDMKNLNNVDYRSTEYSYINCNKKMDKKPASLIDEWEKADKDAKIAQIKKEVTNKKEQEEVIKNLQPSDYLFMMDWTEENVDLQRPDVKVYPTEKIAAKYYNQAGDKGEVESPAEESTQMGTETEIYESLANGEWVDTRERDDSIQQNKYTSLDFYFDNFNLNRTGYEYDNGLKGNIGLEGYLGGGGGGGTGPGDAVNGNGAEIRKKITEMALTIVQEHKDNKACYSNSPRTVDHDKPQRIKGSKCGMSNPIGYDCTSLVSCCYKAAGLSDFYSGTTGQGNVKNNTLLQEVLKKGGKIWFADSEGMAQALPGDVLMSWGKGKLDKSKIADGSGAKASHAMIYMGDGMIAHASKPAKSPDGIRYEKADYYVTGSHAGHSYFLRPKSLVDADAAASSGGGKGGIEDKPGTVDGVSYVMALKGSKCTQYKEGEGGYKDALGNRLDSSKCNTVASHNLPYGTKVYIPAFKNKQSVNPSCIFTVTDTGNAGFDFDICCSPSVWSGSTRLDVYVTEWGTGKAAVSHTYAYKNFTVYESLWKDYVKNGGTTYKVTKFNSDDANITQQDFWKKYS